MGLALFCTAICRLKSPDALSEMPDRIKAKRWDSAKSGKFPYKTPRVIRSRQQWDAREKMTKIAMITGAGSGVGRAVAQALAKDGWRLALVGRKREALEETAKSLTGEHLIAPADVGDPAAVKAVFAQIKDKFG